MDDLIENLEVSSEIASFVENPSSDSSDSSDSSIPFVPLDSLGRPIDIADPDYLPIEELPLTLAEQSDFYTTTNEYKIIASKKFKRLILHRLHCMLIDFMIKI